MSGSLAIPVTRVQSTASRVSDAGRHTVSTKRRNQGGVQTRASAADALVDVEGEGGIGLVIGVPVLGKRSVRKLSSGGSAEQNGQLKIGDSLISISGVDITGCSPETIREMLIGPPGSTVRLGLERTDRITNRVFFYQVDLKRMIRQRSDLGIIDGAGEKYGHYSDKKERSNSKSPDIASSASIPNGHLTAQDPWFDIGNGRLSASEGTLTQNSTPDRTSLWSSEKTVIGSETHNKIQTIMTSPTHKTTFVRQVNNASSEIERRDDMNHGIMNFSMFRGRESRDPYSILEHRKEAELSKLRSEIETTSVELEKAHQETKDAMQKVKDYKDKADHEAAVRASEEIRCASILEREERAQQLWKEETERRKEADERLLTVEIHRDELIQQTARQDGQIKVLTSTIDSMSKEGITVQESMVQLQQELRESKASLSKTNAQLKLVQDELEECDANFFLENNKLKSALALSEACVKSLRTELDGLQERYLVLEGAWEVLERAWEERGLESAKHEENKKRHITQHERDQSENLRLKIHGEKLLAELNEACAELEKANIERGLQKAEIVSLRSKLEELHREIETNRLDKREFTNFEEREKKLKEAMLKSEHQRRELDSQCWLQQEREEQMTKELGQLRIDYSTIARRRIDLEKELGNQEESCELLERENARLTSTISEQNAVIEMYSGQLTAQKQDLSAIQQMVAKLDGKCETQTRQIQSLEDTLEDERTRRSAAENRERDARQSLLQMNDIIRSMEVKQEQASMDRAILASQLAKLHQENADLRSSAHEPPIYRHAEPPLHASLDHPRLLQSIDADSVFDIAKSADLDSTEPKSPFSRAVERRNTLKELQLEAKSPALRGDNDSQQISHIPLLPNPSQQNNSHTNFPQTSSSRDESDSAILPNISGKFVSTAANEASQHLEILKLTETSIEAFCGEECDETLSENGRHTSRSSIPSSSPSPWPSHSWSQSSSAGIHEAQTQSDKSPLVDSASWSAYCVPVEPMDSKPSSPSSNPESIVMEGHIRAAFEKRGGGFVCVSPRELEGELSAGDLVIAIEGNCLVDVPQERLSEYLTGPAGTRVAMMVSKYDQRRRIHLAPVDVMVTIPWHE